MKFPSSLKLLDSAVADIVLVHGALANAEETPEIAQAILSLYRAQQEVDEAIAMIKKAEEATSG